MYQLTATDFHSAEKNTTEVNGIESLVTQKNKISFFDYIILYFLVDNLINAN